MLFERAGDGDFIAPDLYRENAIVTFATHDLPTFPGWLVGHDLAVKRGLGLDPGETDRIAPPRSTPCSARWLGRDCRRWTIHRSRDFSPRRRQDCWS